ncbi:MAG: hypothetical protein ACTHLH_05435 [Solirubrobacterales bacterium]
MAIAAFAAFMTAPVASASPILTSETKAVAVGSEVTAKSTNEVKLTAPPTVTTVTCSGADFTGKVTANSGSRVALEVPAGNFKFSGTAAGGDCTATQGAFSATWGRLCAETVASTDIVSFTGCGTSATLTTTLTNVISCKYSAPAFSATFLTNSDATLSVVEQEFVREEGGIFCPAKWGLDFHLDLTTPAGGTLVIS